MTAASICPMCGRAAVHLTTNGPRCKDHIEMGARWTPISQLSGETPAEWDARTQALRAAPRKPRRAGHAVPRALLADVSRTLTRILAQPTDVRRVKFSARLARRDVERVRELLAEYDRIDSGRWRLGVRP